MGRIILIEPPSELNQYDDDILGTGFYPPLWAISLATYVKEKKIEILDGQYRNVNRFIDNIDYENADIVGISPKTKTYLPSLEIARRFKANGAKVYFGGHHTAALAETILNNRGNQSEDYCVDGIVVGDGEEAFKKIIEGISQKNIENLVFFGLGGLVRNKEVNLDLRELPFADRSLVDLEDYFNRFQKSYPNSLLKKPALIYSQKGCDWRKKSGGCIFCGRMDAGVRHRTPEEFVAEINYLIESRGIDFVWDISDNFLSDDAWFYSFYDAYRRNKEKPKKRIFSRASSITPQIAGMLADINVYEVYIGAESGDNGSLRRMKKGCTSKTNIQAATLLSKEGIRVHACHVLGAPEENEESVKNTLDQVESLTSLDGVEVCGHILEPMPGSEAFGLILEKEHGKYSGKDDYDRLEMERDWVSHFCNISYDRLKELVKVIESFNR